MICKQKLCKGHGTHFKKIHLAYRESSRKLQAKQRSGTGSIVFRCILMKILKAVQCFFTGLYLIKNDQCILCDSLSACHRKILKNTPHILCRPEELRIFRVPIEVKAHISIWKTLSEFLQNPGLANLTCAAQHQRFPPSGALPSLKLTQYQSFHFTGLLLKKRSPDNNYIEVCVRGQPAITFFPVIM